MILTDEEIEKVLKPIFDKMDKGESLSQYEHGILDALDWVLGNGDKPDLD